MSQTILLVEDDESLRLALADNLEEAGYAVDVAATGARARELMAERRHDVVILDIMLPDTDGYTLCRELRAAGSGARVLMLTARTLEDDLVRGFDVGADDYLTKPYRLRELMARVQALARRPGAAATGPEVQVGTHRLDRAARTVRDGGGAVVDLTRTEFELLVYFIDHGDRALSREAILNAVWGADVMVEERTVDNFVSSLKKKLGLGAPGMPTIATVRGVGYRYDA